MVEFIQGNPDLLALWRTIDFYEHPYASTGPERQEYKALGEMAFLDKKMEVFLQSVRADPLDFADRIAYRFLGVTLWYVPSNRADIKARPSVLWINRLIYPLPFFSLLFLLFTTSVRPLCWPQWVVIGIYACYFLPYVIISYYERYAMPMLGVKVLLVLWAADRLLTWRGNSGSAAKTPGELLLE